MKTAAIAILALVGCVDMDDADDAAPDVVVETTSVPNTPPGCTGLADKTWPLPTSPGIYNVGYGYTQGFNYLGQCPLYYVVDITNTGGRSYQVSVPDPGYIAPSDCAATLGSLVIEGYHDASKPIPAGWDALTTQSRYGTFHSDGQWCSTSPLTFGPAGKYLKIRVSTSTRTPQQALTASLRVTVQ